MYAYVQDGERRNNYQNGHTLRDVLIAVGTAGCIVLFLTSLKRAIRSLLWF